MKQSFFIPCSPISWNQLLYKHWRVGHSTKKAMAELTFGAAAGLQKHTKPVHVYACAFFKRGRKHDCDNIFLKAVLDQLVAMEVLVADDSEFVKSVVLTVLTGQEEEGLMITITEA